MAFEVIEHDGVRYAEILWADTTVPTTKFFSPPESSMQFGLLAHHAGFVEPPHSHHPVERRLTDVQQMLVLQRGKLAVDFFTPGGKCFKTVTLNPGDAMTLIHGAHSLRTLEDMQCVSVKQGPFLGDERDKVPLEPAA